MYNITMITLKIIGS